MAAVFPIRESSDKPEPTIEYLTEEALKGLDRLGKKVKSGRYDRMNTVRIPAAYHPVLQDAMDGWNDDDRLQKMYPDVGVAQSYLDGRSIIFETRNRY